MTTHDEITTPGTCTTLQPEPAMIAEAREYHLRSEEYRAASMLYVERTIAQASADELARLEIVVSYLRARILVMRPTGRYAQ